MQGHAARGPNCRLNVSNRPAPPGPNRCSPHCASQTTTDKVRLKTMSISLDGLLDYNTSDR